MSDRDDRKRLERTAALMRRGAELTGPLTGASVGLLGGPLGALAGSAAGFAVQRALLRLGDEFEQRQLGPRQQARAGAALYYALGDIEDRLSAGERLREDGFFDEDDSGRSRADELLEQVIHEVCDDFEERKTRHLGFLLASLAFRSDIGSEHGHFLTTLAANLTYGQLVLISLLHQTPYGTLPLWEALHPFDYRSHAVAGQVFDLAVRGVLFRTDGHPVREYSEADPARMRVGVSGHLLFELMHLDRIDKEVLELAREHVEAVADTPAPIGFPDVLRDAFDTAAFAETDIHEGHIRIPLDERVRGLLPAPGSEPFVMLRGEPVAVRYELENEDVGVLHVHRSHDRQRLADTALPGARMLISRGHDGTLWLD